ncbi:MAG: NADH:flavin oxidoreductase, partial [Muribaculaceae bacterium]|nr:NADH:flavin oxidoreductase [Muribaculaceae bacterium]
TNINSMELKNRIFRGAIGDMDAMNGHITDCGINTYERLAKGGVGTILTGLASVCDYSMFDNYGMLRIDKDEYIKEYEELACMVHEYDCNIVMQLVHCGSNSYVEQQNYAPSAVQNPNTFQNPIELSKEDILRIQNAFADGALRAKEAGFDGVEIHSAHGYLLSQFLTPYFNRRSDEYGESDENRARMLFETIQKVREKVGADYPILVKINSEDCITDGISENGFLTACKMAEDAGANAIEVSGNWFCVKTKDPYYINQAKKLSETIDIPIILVGGVRDVDTTNDILNSTKIDYISLGRPLICEPDLINKWQNGETKKARCISCNGCTKDLNDVTCVLNRS